MASWRQTRANGVSFSPGLRECSCWPYRLAFLSSKSATASRQAIWNSSALTEPYQPAWDSSTAVLFAPSGMGVDAGGTNPGIDAALDRRSIEKSVAVSCEFPSSHVIQLGLRRKSMPYRSSLLGVSAPPARTQPHVNRRTPCAEPAWRRPWPGCRTRPCCTNGANGLGSSRETIGCTTHISSRL